MRLTAQIICDIIKAGMALDSDQIWIYNQRRAIPEDKRLYITVSVLTLKPYANNNRPVATLTGMNDSTSQYIQETLQVDLMSYTMEALERYSEVMASLVSTYSQQQQATYALKIASVPTMINDVSAVEGATMLNRIALTLPVLRKYDNIMAATYYDTFNDPVIAKTE